MSTTTLHDYDHCDQGKAVRGIVPRQEERQPSIVGTELAFFSSNAVPDEWTMTQKPMVCGEGGTNAEPCRHQLAHASDPRRRHGGVG
ncbi:MAG: hypothetical protein ABTQ30_12925 [Rhizobiaceae bacterium]